MTDQNKYQSDWVSSQSWNGDRYTGTRLVRRKDLKFKDLSLLLLIESPGYIYNVFYYIHVLKVSQIPEDTEELIINVTIY